MATPRKKKKPALEPTVLPKEESEESDFESKDEEGEEPDENAIQVLAPQSLLENTPEVPDTELTTVGASDPLRRYMEEVRRHPLLSPEEEFKLTQRLKESGDLDAARRLVEANLRLVVKIAFEYRSIYSNVLDLIQEGNIGLMKAVSKYDPTKGARLSYYSSWWIRSYILKYLLDNFRLMRVGTTQAQKKLFYHLMREKERMEAQGLLTAPKLLAERLNVREKDVIEMSQRLSPLGAEMSLDAPLGSDEDAGGGRSRGDLIGDGREGVDDQLARAEWIQLLHDRLPAFRSQLNEKERNVLESRILSEEPKTLQEIADQYGLTRERTRQIEAKVITKLQEFLGKDLK